MKANPQPTFKYALVSMMVLFALLVTGIVVLELNLQLTMFIGLMAAIPIAMKIGFSYSEVEGFAFDMIRNALGVIMILIAVGTLIGTWAAAGTISTLTSIGLQIIHPTYFLVTALILCSIVSMATGTSWGTIGSVGIALIGVSEAFGIPAGMAAGAIISGAVFGDKLSPLSDSTNMAAAVSRVDLMAHVRHMLWTTVPALMGTAVLFTIVGFMQGTAGAAAGAGQLETIQSGIAAELQTGWVTLLPIAIVITLLIMQKPALPAIFVGTLAGLAVAVFYQGFSFTEGIGFMWGGYVSGTGIAIVDELLTTGGIVSMLNTVVLFLFALGFGGILTHSGLLGTVLRPLFRKVDSVRKLIPATLAVTFVNCGVGASGNFAYAVTGPAMAPMYERLNLDRANLSRTMEDAGAVSGVIIPWHITAVFAAGTLGVGQFEFIPFLFLSYLSPLVALIYGLTGFAIKKADGEEEGDEDGGGLPAGRAVSD